MSENDIKIIRNPGARFEFDTEDRTTSTYSATIKPGEPVGKYAAAYASVASANIVLPLPTGAPRINSDIFAGVAVKESTETSSADGYCLVEMCIPSSTVLRGNANTSTNMDVASELRGLMMDSVMFDRSSVALTAGTFTIDENESDDPNVYGLCIVGGDIEKFTLDVIVHVNACLGSSLVGQTMD